MTETKPCSSTHEPTDYAHFEAMTKNRRPWGWSMSEMVVGECSECGTSITYPEDQSASITRPEMDARISRLERGFEELRKPSCFVPHSGLKHDVTAEMDRIQARAIHTQKYPSKATRRLSRLLDRRAAREERRNSARARMAADRLREELAANKEKR